MTRILIADDHDVVRAGVRAILQLLPGWADVGEACDGTEAVELAVATRPDIVILDFGLPTLNGVEATRQIRSRFSRVEILIFTMHDTDALIRDVLESGARGFLLKSDASRFLISAVETLADHVQELPDRLLPSGPRQASGATARLSSSLSRLFTFGRGQVPVR